MAATNPSNFAFLNPNGFQFTIAKYPELNFQIQDVNLPDITLGTAMQASSLHDIRLPGETLEFGALNITFIIDSKMENYFAIHDWMIGLGFPESHAMFNELVNSPRNSISSEVSGVSINTKTSSDCILQILDGNNLPLKTFIFVDAFPTNLGSLQLTSTSTDVNYIVANVTLDYSYYKLK